MKKKKIFPLVLFVLIIATAGMVSFAVHTGKIRAGGVHPVASAEETIAHMRTNYDVLFKHIVDNLFSPAALRIGTFLSLALAVISVFRTRNVYLGFFFYFWAVFFAYIGPFVVRWFK